MMTIQAMQATLARVDRVLKFYMQCPASKKGRPMSVANAVRLEKAHLGSVCAKEVRARDGKGVRQVFYKVKSGTKVPLDSESEYDKPQSKGPAKGTAREATKTTKPEKTSQKESPKPVNKPQNIHKEEKKAARPKEGQSKFKSNVIAKSAKQARWAKAFHHQIFRKLEPYLSKLKEVRPEYKSYAQEAMDELANITTPGPIFGLKGLEPVQVFWSLLSAESARKLASSANVNLVAAIRGAAFTRIMKAKFKDDPTFQEALTKKASWPVRQS